MRTIKKGEGSAKNHDVWGGQQSQDYGIWNLFRIPFLYIGKHQELHNSIKIIKILHIGKLKKVSQI